VLARFSLCIEQGVGAGEVRGEELRQWLGKGAVDEPFADELLAGDDRIDAAVVAYA
jgi:hypothetical protein